ncbi:MAG: helix-turn-helix domain-containing protein [Candidatus Bathyarchaeota archaeon]|jgi:sugar-specific transcriptional regulator TrmB
MNRSEDTNTDTNKERGLQVLKTLKDGRKVITTREIEGIEPKKRLPAKNHHLPDLLSKWPKIMDYAGLSEYEAKVYLSLLCLGSSGARNLSLASDVPRTKVYGTLNRLIDFGLVTEIPGAPKCFAPTPPSNAFGSALKRTLNKSQDFSEVMEALVETHKKVKNDSSPQEKLLWHIDVNDDIIEKCHEIITQSKETIEVLASADGLTLLFKSAPNLLDQMKNQGVKVSISSPLDPKANPLARELSYLFEVKKVDITTPILYINSDNRIFIVARIDDINSGNPLDEAVFSDDLDVISILHLLLVDLKDRLQVFNGQPHTTRTE